METRKNPTTPDHDEELARAFDSQAPLFERAPVQSDPVALVRLVEFADLAPDSLVLDAGCGPGLVCAALLAAGHRVAGVDLSAEMIARARNRCVQYGDRARFLRGSLFDQPVEEVGPFDAALSRYVLHHIADPPRFVARQVELLKRGGVLILCDHVTDPDRAVAEFHNAIEFARDKTHTRNLTGGELVDLVAGAGLSSLKFLEEPFVLDFDEWFDRGTPAEEKAAVRSRFLSGPKIRSFHATPLPDGPVRIEGIRASIRAEKTRR
jgi:SAM-dependent methyltransferase